MASTKLDRPSIRSSGCVIDSLEDSLWAVANSDDFEEAVLLAAKLGGDAYATETITGPFGRAIWGASGIPKNWRRQLGWRDEITGFADIFYERIVSSRESR